MRNVTSSVRRNGKKMLPIFIAFILKLSSQYEKVMLVASKSSEEQQIKALETKENSFSAIQLIIETEQNFFQLNRKTPDV